MKIIKTPRFCKTCNEWTTLLNIDDQCAVCKSVVYTKRELKAAK